MILSIVLPVPMIALLVLSRKRSIMGAFTATAVPTILAAVAAVLVFGLNAVLLLQTFGLLRG